VEQSPADRRREIDLGFVRDIADDPDDRAIVQAIISLARGLRLLVVAEGVETEAQRDFLAARECHACQGYLFDRPAPIEDFGRLLAKESQSIKNGKTRLGNGPNGAFAKSGKGSLNCLYCRQGIYFMTEPGEITVLLRDWSAGNPAATEHLFELVYPQLRKIAGALFRGERPENLLQPTSVVNELFLKLIRQRSLRFEDREHFYSLSARLMRRVLVDHARSEGRQKRDGGVPVPLHPDLAWIDARPAEMIDLDRILEELEQLDPRKCRMVELRFFLGFTAEETAELLNSSKATVDRELRFVRGWLYERLHSS
jgi:RNA polymerase sigma factor (TIGR02999 family)